MNDLKQRFSIRVCAPDYDAKSGGIRALYLLCHELNALGFRAHVPVRTPETPADLNAPQLSESEWRSTGEDNAIALYSETAHGDGLQARHVIRFLLNRPGFMGPDPSILFGKDDFILTFDKAHVPRGRAFFDMFMPLVDRRFYYPPPAGSPREGFVICSKRMPERPVVVPPWAKPLTLVLPHRPRSHAELGELYRGARALIAYERSTAIYEALGCGCPVICVPSTAFSEATYQTRFGGAGMAWELTEAALAKATATVPAFTVRYEQIERDFPDRLESAFISILRAAAARSA